MLTPQEITDKVFVKAVFGGYDMTGVDDFLETLSADYSALYKENAILKGKLKVLVEKVEEYRSTEDAMRMALLTAQRMGEEITVEANKQKEETLKSVDEEAKLKLSEMKKRVSDEEAKLTIASKETAKFIQLSQAIIQKHSEFLTKLETARRTVRPDLEPAPPPPTQEEQIADVAEQIDSAVGKLTASDAHAPTPIPVHAPAPAYKQTEMQAETQSIETQAEMQTEVYTGTQLHVHTEAPEEPVAYDTTEPSGSEEDDSIMQFGEDGASSITPRPRFDFEDLKFGANFDNR